ncbi:MAG: transporter substrate-binding domain-containing protein [Oscillospiraceae bacterium]|nr:transporter substrate-binding domain-containing protein [Oscillospiraceae bacterium]
MKKFSIFSVFILLFLIVLPIFTAAGCASATGKLAKIQSKGEIVVYTDPNFPPFESSDGNGVKGVDIEIAKAIATELGVTATFKEANFDSILMAIKGGKGDIAISGFTITDERKKSVDFSEPYIESVQYLILPNDSTIAVMEDLAGKRVGVAKGYTGQFLMDSETSKDDNGNAGVLYNKNTQIKEYNSAMEAVLDMNAGRIDAVVMDQYVAENIVSQNADIQAIELVYQNGSAASEEYGVAVPKGNEDLVEKINQVIEQLKADGKIPEWMVQFSQ